MKENSKKFILSEIERIQESLDQVNTVLKLYETILTPKSQEDVDYLRNRQLKMKKELSELKDKLKKF